MIDQMTPELTAAIIAAAVALISSLLTNFVTLHQFRAELHQQERQWQEGFRAEVRSRLISESTLHTHQLRVALYGELWKSLQVTSGYHIKRSNELRQDVQGLADALTKDAYGVTGMLMSDRSRRILNSLRSACGSYVRGEADIGAVVDQAHLLKHSLRSDLGIEDYLYENEMNAIALRLGRVDDWADHRNGSSL